MSKTQLWNVSEIRFKRPTSWSVGRSGRSDSGRVRSRELGRKAVLKYPGFLEPEFLQEILPDEFGT